MNFGRSFYGAPYKKEEKGMEKICIIGLGYIGLPTAIIAARHGFSVVGFDIDEERIERIKAGDPVIKEPDIAEQLESALYTGKFKVQSTLEFADCFVIAVPTPFKENKKADLSYIWAAVHDLVAYVRPGNVIIIESTIPVGLTEEVATFLENKTGLILGHTLFVAHCPERVLPGNIFYELVYNPRIIGGVRATCMHKAKEFYNRFVRGSLYLTSATAAEMIKLIENSSRDVQIAFANQVAAMAYSLDLNPFEIIELANKHPRVSILNPSCGVGGHCIAVDPWFLVESFPEQTQLLKAARLINDAKPLQVIETVRKAVVQWQNIHKTVPTVLALGVTYKPNVDDVRESPALLIAKKLSDDKDMRLLVCDPYAPLITMYDTFGSSVVSLENGMTQADLILCLVKHAEFQKIALLKNDKQKILDFCGLLHISQTDAPEMVFWPEALENQRVLL